MTTLQAAQQAEVYWMALARDIPFSQYAHNDVTRLAAGKPGLECFVFGYRSVDHV